MPAVPLAARYLASMFGLVASLLLVAALLALGGGGTYAAYRLFQRER